MSDTNETTEPDERSAAVMCADLLALKARQLLAEKERATATMNHDLHRYGEWRADYSGWHCEIDMELEKIFSAMS
jgi:hypothetical protein